MNVAKALALFAFGITSSLAMAAPAAAAPQGTTWQRAESRHFVIYAQDKPERVADFATRLERFDAGLRALFGLDDADAVPSRRVTIFVLDDTGDVQRMFGKGGLNVAGFYKPLSSGSVAFVPRDRKTAEWALNGQQVLLHEYAHHFMFEHWSQIPMPSWLVEGFAEFNATATFAPDGSVQLGAVPLYRGRQLLGDVMPIGRVVQAQNRQLHGVDRSALYARGWLLTHYLLTQPAQLGRYAAYLDALKNGQSPTEAAVTAFGDLSRLDRALTAYMGQPLRGFDIPPDKLQIAPVQVAPISAGAAAIMPAMMETMRGANAGDPGKIVERARTLGAPYPDDPAVLNELAQAELDAGNAPASLADATRAAQIDPQSVHARIYQGRAAMRLAVAARDRDPAHWQEIRQYFLDANRIDPNNAEALQLFYTSFSASGARPTPNAEDALLHAYDIAPFDLGLRMRAAIVKLHRQDAAGARAILASVAYNPHAEKLGDEAEAVLDALDKGGTQAALAALAAARGGGAPGEKPAGGN